jgi:membrane-associated phospholipid phosphatase
VQSVKCIVVLFIAFQVFSAAGQTLTFQAQNYSLHDTVMPTLENQLAAHQKFPVTSFIVPVALMTYGFVALSSDALQDLNEHVKNKIWTENPHSTTHIDNYLQFAPALAVYGLNLSGIKGRNNYFDCTMIYIMSNIIMNSSVYLVKNLSHEQRPDGSDYLSFPSGHTAEAFLSAEFLFQEYKDVSVWYGVAGYTVAAGVGFLRMYNNKHWLSDVIAGAGFGMTSTKLTYWLYPKIKRLFSKNKPLHSMIMPSYNNRSFSMVFVHEF